MMSADDPIPYVLVDDELPVPYVPVGYPSGYTLPTAGQHLEVCCE